MNTGLNLQKCADVGQPDVRLLHVSQAVMRSVCAAGDFMMFAEYMRGLGALCTDLGVQVPVSGNPE